MTLLDKLQHFSVCFLISAIGASVVGLATGHCLASLFCGAYSAMTTGLCKEYCDNLYGGSVDYYDLLADLVGALIGGAVFAYTTTLTL
jgi:VanZ family protein